MNIKRWISGLLGLPLISALLIFGNIYVVDIAFSVCALIALNEFFNAFKGKARPIVEIAYISALLIAGMHILNYNVWLVSFPIILLLLFLKVLLTKMKVNIVDLSITLLGIIYVVGLFAFIPFINGLENGKFLIWYIFLPAWGTDVLAYIIGKKFGKHKFSKISPNKSIEGCIGGILGSILLTIIYTFIINTIYGFNISYLYIMLISVVLSLIGQVGDFAASSIKRFVGIKDYSNLIPGHGGILDRMDSVMFVAPFTYLFVVLAGIII